MTVKVVRHEFVDLIPEELAEGTIYVSIPYATVVHKCLSGCGLEVVTPLSPMDWKLTFDGETISLHPSIGNWGFSCRSHYWIRRDRVVWAPSWSRAQIERGRARDRATKDAYYQSKIGTSQEPAPEGSHAKRKGFWSSLKGWFSQL